MNDSEFEKLNLVSTNNVLLTNSQKYLYANENTLMLGNQKIENLHMVMSIKYVDVFGLQYLQK